MSDTMRDAARHLRRRALDGAFDNLDTADLKALLTLADDLGNEFDETKVLVPLSAFTRLFQAISAKDRSEICGALSGMLTAAPSVEGERERCTCHPWSPGVYDPACPWDEHRRAAAERDSTSRINRAHEAEPARTPTPAGSEPEEDE